METDDGELQRLLVLDTWSSTGVGSRCRRGSDKVGSVDLDLVEVLRLHLRDGSLRLAQQLRWVDESEAHGDTRRVGDGVRVYLDDGRRERPCGRLEDEVESVVRVEGKPAELRARVGERVRDCREPLSVPPDGQPEELGLCELELVPFERNARLRRVPHAQLGRLGLVRAKLAEDVVLEVPEPLRRRTLGGEVARARDVDDGPGSNA